MARRWVAAGSRVAPLDDLQMSEAAISPDKVTFSHAPSKGHLTRQFRGMIQNVRLQMWVVSGKLLNLGNNFGPETPLSAVVQWPEQRRRLQSIDNNLRWREEEAW